MTRLYTEEFSSEQLVCSTCPHFEECGSCQLQHISDEHYKTWKADRLKTLLAENELEIEEWLEPVFISEGGRRRVTLNALRHENEVFIGYNKYHSHDLAPIKNCLLLTPQLQSIVEKLPQALKNIAHKNHAIELLVQEADGGLFDCVITGLDETGARQTGSIAAMAEQCGLARISFRKDAFSKCETQVSLTPIKKTNGAITVDLPAAAFLQPSAAGEAALIDAVLQGLSRHKLGKKDKVADLFSGCGTFAGHLLNKYTVHAAEGDWAMANSLVEAAKGHARFSAEVRDLFKEPIVGRELRDYKAAVFDPPRAGAKEQAQMLAKSNLPVVIGVSCNPSTFARDAKILLAGGYKLKTIQMVDQFTWSTHTELVGVFEKYSLLT
ncbi:MAG TPA: class I SAM-dependent RNA methyltransferase [Alphaproteobacteria bacterium]|nr:class I SAM-dependent RNA methyltransferase [Alphaproteobacteria bacterium]